MISLNSISVSFDSSIKEALSSVSFEIEKGEFVSLAGQNGSGKTSLYRAMLGLIPYSGSSKILDIESKDCSRKELSKLISFIPQEMPVIKAFSVLDVLLMSRLTHKKDGFLNSFASFTKKDKEISLKALKETGMESFSKREFSSLSGGEKQKVLIASSLAQETPIIFLDEPGSFLDPGSQEELYLLLESLNKKQQKTIVTSSHDLNCSSFYSKRIIALKSGKKVFDGSSSDFMNERRLKEIFNKDFLLSSHPSRNIKMILPREKANES